MSTEREFRPTEEQLEKAKLLLRLREEFEYILVPRAGVLAQTSNDTYPFSLSVMLTKTELRELLVALQGQRPDNR